MPDVSQLEPKVVQLLALQRLQLLFSKPVQSGARAGPTQTQAAASSVRSAPDPTQANADLSERLVAEVKEQTQQLLNGWTQTQAKKPQKKGKSNQITTTSISGLGLETLEPVLRAAYLFPLEPLFSPVLGSQYNKAICCHGSPQNT